MLESAVFLSPVISGESMVLVVGFFGVQGLFDLYVEMGRGVRRSALIHYGSRFVMNEARVDMADAFFERHGSKAVFWLDLSYFPLR